MDNSNILARLLMGYGHGEPLPAPSPLSQLLMTQTLIPSPDNNPQSRRVQLMPEMQPSREAVFGMPGERDMMRFDPLQAGLDVAGGPTMASIMAPGRMGIRAFHGSPHKFDKFDMSRIGTGEGAQAYGHGLYFAEREGVARDYQRRLSEMAWTPKDPTPETLRIIEAIKREAPNQSPQEAAQFLREKWRQYWNYSQEGGQTPAKAQVYQDAARKYSDMADWIIDNQGNLSRGHMYEVNIRANPEQFLDWDRPLSQQPRAIQERVAPIAGMTPEQVSMTELYSGQGAYRDIAISPKNPASGAAFMPNYATNALREAGIPGIKYLDQGSRGLNQSGIDLLRRDLEAARVAGNSDKAAILERDLARLTPTSNYVVFDDSLIDILKRYGLAGGAATPVLSQLLMDGAPSQ